MLLEDMTSHALTAEVELLEKRRRTCDDKTRVVFDDLLAAVLRELQYRAGAVVIRTMNDVE